MKSFDQFLAEGRDAPLYHGTSLPKAVGIISSNRLEARETPDYAGERNVVFNDVGHLRVVSVTRSYPFAANWTSGYGVVFELDQSKLTQNHKLVPYNFFSGTSRSQVTAGQKINWYAQSEEMVIGTISNLDKYLTRVIIPNSHLFYKYWSRSRAKQTGIDLNIIQNHPLLYLWNDKEWVNR